MSILLAVVAGVLIGLSLGALGGGGSILAVPLLVYVVGVSSPHVAIGTSALAVSVSALGNLGSHWRAGHVKWPCAAVFAGAGVLGAAAGSTAAKALDGEKLLALFGIVMLVVGVLMLRERQATGDPDVRLSNETARELLPLLLGIGFGVGLFSGFFGIGGGFLIVPGLILATDMGRPLVKGFFKKRTSSVQYVVVDPETESCAIIDPVLDFDLKSGATATHSADALLSYVDDQGLRLQWILDTHPHADHFSAAGYLKDRTSVPTAIGEKVVEVQKLWQGIYNVSDCCPADGSQWDRPPTR